VLSKMIDDLKSRVVIAVVSTNDVRHVVPCLQSLAMSTYRNFQVIICENGGPDAFERLTGVLANLEFLDELNADHRDKALSRSRNDHRSFLMREGRQVVTVLNPLKNLGYAGGVNACIAAVRDEAWDAVWVLNPDAFPDPAALEALLRHQKKGNYGIVGSCLIATSDGRVQAWGGMRWWPLLGRGRTIGSNQAAEIVPDTTKVEEALAFISGASMFVSRAYVESVGVMDEDFFVYNEDVDWCLRRGPFRLGYAHNSVVRHVGGGTSGAFASSGSRFTVYLDSRNRILLARKMYGPKWPLIAVIALTQPLYLLLRYQSVARFRISLEGWWAGIRDERGMPGFMRQTPPQA
jgi:N-acetylglucosaminyl-diphospho-decaprenol L-rhamnosyltransferase